MLLHTDKTLEVVHSGEGRTPRGVTREYTHIDDTGGYTHSSSLSPQRTRIFLTKVDNTRETALAWPRLKVAPVN